jgi:tRNA(Ile)-lysidine synthase
MDWPAWPALTEHRQARLLRPLLGVNARAVLTATLQEAPRYLGCTIVRNSDPRFERARLRAGGALRHRRDGPRAKAGPGVKRASPGCRCRARHGGAAGQLPSTAWRSVPSIASKRRRLLSRVVQSVGGRDHPPRRDRLERAADAATAGRGPGKIWEKAGISRCLHAA